MSAPAKSQSIMCFTYLSSPSKADDTVAGITVSNVYSMMNVITAPWRTSYGIDWVALKTITSDLHFKSVVDSLHRVAGKTFIQIARCVVRRNAVTRFPFID